MGAKEQGADAVEGRWLMIPRAVCFVTNGDDVLLLKRGAHKRVFPNQYDGVGGHIERDEDVLTGVRREVFEETGLTVRDVRLRSVYSIDAGAATGVLLFQFSAVSDDRAFVDSDEGTLDWFPQAHVGELDLIEDLPILLPRMLAMGRTDAPLFVHISYNDADKMVLRFAEA